MDFTGYTAPAQQERELPPWLIDWTPFADDWSHSGALVHLVHAPPGCDQEALVGELKDARCWYWEANGANSGDDSLLFEDSAEFLVALGQTSVGAPGYLCIFVDPRSSSRFPWQAAVERFVNSDPRCALLLFSQRVPEPVLEWIAHGDGHQWVNLVNGDSLAYSSADIELLATRLGAASPESFAACVLSVSRGWPWVSKCLLWQFREAPFDHAEAVSATIDICKQVGPSDEELDLAGLLQFAGPVPWDAFADAGPLANYAEACVRGFENGWILRQENGSSSVTPGAFISSLLVGTEVASRYHACLVDVARWLEQGGYHAKALNLYLALRHWSEAERVLLNIAEQYIAVLDVAPVTEWLDRLDAGRPVEHPILLVSFIRCGIYEGSEITVKRYFTRLIEQFDIGGEGHFREILGEHRWQRLMAEVQVYSLVTGLGSDHPMIVDMPAEIGNGTSPAALMQEAYQYVLDGRLADLLPVLCAGLKQTHQQGLWPYHTVFSILNFWALMLSGRHTMAMTFLGETRQLLSENQVSFTGAYEWLELLELLAARLEGKLGYCKDRLLQLIDDNRYFSDNIKCHVLLSLQCEVAITCHDLGNAETVLDELLLRRKNAASRSYWLPSALVMERAISLLTGTGPEGEPATPESEEVDNEVQVQTGILWTLKMDLHAGLLEGVEARLRALRQRCVNQGQWLRLLETRLLLAVYLLRTGQPRQALRKFSDVVEKLISEQMTGVLLDPFLLWLPFLEQRLPADQRDVLERLVSQIPDSGIRLSSAQVKLTAREQQVLSLLVKGMRNQAIADELSVSVTTVRTHLQNIYDKLGVSNRAAATGRAMELGIV